MTDGVRIGDIARMTGLSTSRVRQLADAGEIPSRRTEGGHRVFDAAEVALVLELRAARRRTARPLGPPDLGKEWSLGGLEEHEVWREVAGLLGLTEPREAVHIVEYAFSEMLNNAIDHSGGTSARVLFWRRPDLLAFAVADDGVGALARLQHEHRLPDTLSAIQELTKGKRTTAPEAHSGQGIFFSSKAVDEFTLSANGWRWTVDNEIGDQFVAEAPHAAGTVVLCRLDPATPRTMADVFGGFTHDLAFDRTRPRVGLLSYGTRLISRSEARLLVEGLDRFAEVELDFAGVESVGQGFVDEVFRVWAVAHPATRLIPVDANAAVRFMIERGLPGPVAR